MLHARLARMLQLARLVRPVRLARLMDVDIAGDAAGARAADTSVHGRMLESRSRESVTGNARCLLRLDETGE